MTMGEQNKIYSEREWNQLTWRPCDHCGADVIPHPMSVKAFGHPGPRYQLSYAECTASCTGPGPVTFGGRGHAYRTD